MSSKRLVGVFSILLPISMVFSFYVLPTGGSIGSLTLYVVFAVMLFIAVLNRKKICFGIPKELGLFLFYIIVTQPIAFISNGGFEKARFINLLTIFIMVFMLSYVKLNRQVFYKSYFIIGTFAAIIIAIQYVQIFLLGKVVHQVMLLPIDIYETWYSGGVRPAGIFPEPAAYATFIIPLVYYLLDGKKYFSAFMFTISIFMSTSSLGAIVIAFLWITEILKGDIRKRNRIILVIAISLMTIIVVQTNFFEYSTEKILKTNFASNVRLTRGFIIYDKLDWPDKVFGIGVNNLNYYLNQGKIHLADTISVGMRNKSYITGLFQVSIFYGMFGLLIYTVFLVNNIRRSKCKSFATAFILMSIASSFLFNTNWLVYTLLILDETEYRSKYYFVVGSER